MKNTITTFQAIELMRKLSKIGVPFSFSFMSYNSTKGTTEGVRYVDRALLRPGFRKDQSDKSDTLIAFTEYPSSKPRFFHLSLLLTFNDYEIKNDKQ